MWQFRAFSATLIEGKTLTAEEIAMFEMFERKRGSHERRLAFIRRMAQRLAEKYEE